MGRNKISKGLKCFVFCMLVTANAYSQNISKEIYISNDHLHEYFGNLSRVDAEVFCIYTYEPKDSSELYSNSKLMRINNHGDTAWFEFNKIDSNIRLLDIITNDSGNLVLAGNLFTPYSQRTKKQWFCEMTSSFDIIWESVIDCEGDSTSTRSKCLGQTFDGNYIYVVNSYDYTINDPYMYGITFSNQGDSLRYHEFEMPFIGGINSITAGVNRNELHIRHNDYGSPFHCKIHCIDENFSTQSFHHYPIELLNDPFYTINYSSGSYVCLGRYWTIGYYGLKAIIFDTINWLAANTTLTQGQEDTYPAWNKGVDYYYDNQIYVAGMLGIQGSYPSSPNEFYVACLNENLDILQEYLIGGDGYYNVYNVSATSDGGVIVAGSYYDHLSASDQNDAFLIKIDSSSFVGQLEYLSEKKEKIIIYPNPTSHYMNIRFSLFDTRYSLFIYDIFGRLMDEIILPPWQEESRVDVSSYPDGVYLVVLSDDKGIVGRRKFVVAKQ